MESFESNEVNETNENVNFESRINLEPLKASVDKIRHELGKVIVGQHKMIDQLIVSILANGHILLEGVPGLAKTLTISTVARVLHLDFARIQFTPDLLPSDLIGTMVYHQETHEFVPKKGPIFANIILADEINRAPAKVQSALLEAMAEKQVTISENTFRLDDPFLVRCIFTCGTV